jgi:hypothetical protein
VLSRTKDLSRPGAAGAAGTPTSHARDDIPAWEAILAPLIEKINKTYQTLLATNGLAEEDKLLGQVAQKVLTAIHSQMQWKLLEQITGKKPNKDVVEARINHDHAIAQTFRDEEQVDDARKTEAELIKFLEEALQLARQLLEQIDADRNKAVRAKLETCREEALQLLLEGQEVRDAVVKTLNTDLAILGERRDTLHRMTRDQFTEQQQEEVAFQQFCEDEKQRRDELATKFIALLKEDWDRQVRFKDRMKEHIAFKAKFAASLQECKNLEAHIDQRERVCTQRQQIESKRREVREDIKFLISSALNGTMDKHEKTMEILSSIQMDIKRYYLCAHTGYFKLLSVSNCRSRMALESSEGELKEIKTKIKKASNLDDAKKVAKLKKELAEAQSERKRRESEMSSNQVKLDLEEKFAAKLYEELRQPHARVELAPFIEEMERAQIQSQIDDLVRAAPNKVDELKKRLQARLIKAPAPASVPAPSTTHVTPEEPELDELQTPYEDGDPGSADSRSHPSGSGAGRVSASSSLPARPSVHVVRGSQSYVLPVVKDYDSLMQACCSKFGGEVARLEYQDDDGQWRQMSSDSEFREAFAGRSPGAEHLEVRALS